VPTDEFFKRIAAGDHTAGTAVHEGRDGTAARRARRADDHARAIKDVQRESRPLNGPKGASSRLASVGRKWWLTVYVGIAVLIAITLAAVSGLGGGSRSPKSGPDAGPVEVYTVPASEPPADVKHRGRVPVAIRQGKRAGDHRGRGSVERGAVPASSPRVQLAPIAPQPLSAREAFGFEEGAR
jgi:hypothetical protein